MSADRRPRPQPEIADFKLAEAHRRVLRAMAQGRWLKAHRYVDGTKTFRLHALDGAAETVDRGTVEFLTDRGLIDSNKKFPAATYWLTAAGRSAAQALIAQEE